MAQTFKRFKAEKPTGTPVLVGVLWADGPNDTNGTANFRFRNDIGNWSDMIKGSEQDAKDSVPGATYTLDAAVWPA